MWYSIPALLKTATLTIDGYSSSYISQSQKNVPNSPNTTIFTYSLLPTISFDQRWVFTHRIRKYDYVYTILKGVLKSIEMTVNCVLMLRLCLPLNYIATTVPTSFSSEYIIQKQQRCLGISTVFNTITAVWLHTIHSYQ